MPPVVLLVDIGNTHTHAAVANGERIVADTRFASESLVLGQAELPLAKLLRLAKAGRLAGAVFCSVVPRLNPPLKRLLRVRWQCAAWQLTARTVTGIGIEYPKPATIGADRLANAIAAHERFGAPVVVVDFGTAVTFDVVDAAGNYTGGIIAPGLSAMTDYLHEKTALLPRIKIAEPESVVGRRHARRDAQWCGARLSRIDRRVGAATEARAGFGEAAGGCDGRLRGADGGQAAGDPARRAAAYT